MKLFILTSSASILLGAVPGVFSSEEYKLRGSSSAIAKSIESVDKVLHTEPAVFVGKSLEEDECESYDKNKSSEDDKNSLCSQTYTGCCSNDELYKKNRDFCECAGFDEPKSITVDTPWTMEAEDVHCKCDWDEDDDDDDDEDNKKEHDDDDDDEDDKKEHDDDDDDEDDKKEHEDDKKEHEDDKKEHEDDKKEHQDNKKEHQDDDKKPHPPAVSDDPEDIFSPQ